MRIARLLALAVASLVLLATPTLAEKARMSPEAMWKIATHVVTADVVAIYARATPEGLYSVTRYVAEVRVREIEKGEGIGKDAPIYVRYWTQKWIGPGPAPLGTSGHRGLPSAGETHRIYLARNAYDGFTDKNNDGGFNVILANGFEKLPPPDPVASPKPAAP